MQGATGVKTVGGVSRGVTVDGVDNWSVTFVTDEFPVGEFAENVSITLTSGDETASEVTAVRDFSAIREFCTASTIGTLTDLPFIVLFLALVASIGGKVVWVLFISAAIILCAKENDEIDHGRTRGINKIEPLVA